MRTQSLRFGLSVGGAYVHSEHEVAHDQQEPGLSSSEQAGHHVQDFLLASASADIAWAPVSWLALEASLPFRSTQVLAAFLDDDREAIEGFQSIHHRTELILGPGDPRLAARWQPLVSSPGGGGPALGLSFGATVPLGRTEPDPFELGAAGKRHQHMFFGTGTVDPVLGANGSWGWDWGRLGAEASLRAGLFRNRFRYRPPTSLAGTAFAESGLGAADWRFRLGVFGYGETPADWGGRVAEASGRVDVGVVGAVFWRGRRGVEPYLLARVVPLTFAVGGQLSAPVFVVAGANWAVPLAFRD